MGFDYRKVTIFRNKFELLTFKLSFVLFWSILPIWVVVSNQSTSKAVDDLLVLMSKGLTLPVCNAINLSVEPITLGKTQR